MLCGVLSGASAGLRFYRDDWLGPLLLSLRMAQTAATPVSDSGNCRSRQTVLTAFQQVEDNLAALRILDEQAAAQDRAVKAAQTSLDVTTDQYRNGVADYLQVITAQTTLLANQVTAIGILTSRMTANVQLVEALGGGWDASELPSPAQLRSASSGTPPQVP